MDTLIKELNSKLDTIRESEDFSIINEFSKKLLSSNSDEILTYHLSLLRFQDNFLFHNVMCSSFSKRGEQGADFLFKKLLDEKTSTNIKADIIHILGVMKYEKILSILPKTINDKNEIIRYKTIIVLGWLGSRNEIDILANVLNSGDIDYLRGFSATAMRQIWFRHENLSKVILNIFLDILPKEKKIWSLL